MQETLERLLLLHWKYWVLHIRKPCGMICDFLFPILMALLLCTCRLTGRRTLNEKEIYEPFCVSPDPVPFLCPLNSTKNSSEFDDIPKSLFYSPDNPQLARVMKIYKVFGYEVKPKRNADEMVAAFRINANTTMAGIQFDDSYSKIADLKDIKNIKVSIRFPAELRKPIPEDELSDEILFRDTFWDTQSKHGIGGGPRNPKSSIGGNPSYYNEGFLHLQQILVFGFILARDSSIDMLSNDVNESYSKIAKWAVTKKFPQVYMQQFPHTEWWSDPATDRIKVMISIVTLVAFAPFFMSTVKMMVLEKERQLKEFMKVMGLTTALYWTSWFLQCFVYLFMILAIFLILLTVAIFGRNPVFVLSSPSLISFFLLVWGTATITSAFIFAALFHRATKAAIIGLLIWFLPLLIVFDIPGKSTSVQVAACLWSNIALDVGFQTILTFEKVGEGAQWRNLFTPAYAEKSASLGIVILMLILDTVLYLFIAVYIEAVLPGEFGVRHPWNFVCKKRYWRPKPNADLSDIRAIQRTESGLLEPEPKDLKVGVQIKSMTKTFGSTTAVRELTLNLYENQITVLLGHNGAGKTTTISMLTGMIPPTSGTAVIGGYDIRRDMRLIRHRMGICPQHNILYDSLTVYEHLYFYSRMQGMSIKETKAELKQFLKAMDLGNKRKVVASSLSGGMKRKLSVCIALCGNSNIVMLDEPTSGMDPSARRKLWDLMLKNKTGKTILLTTHFMDEADVLGDRIAIMSGGELKCCGSSFFLKKKYGSGYVLTIDKGPRCDVPKITSLLKSFVPDVELTSNSETEVTYTLPENRVSSFEVMLKQLESQSSSIGVQSYGISLSTMEDVFMKAGVSQGQDASNRQNISLTGGSRTPTNASGIRLISNQFIAMLLKKIKSFQRSPTQWAIHFLLAPIFLLIWLMSGGNSIISELPPLALSLSEYNDPVTLVENLGDSGGYYDSYKDLIQDEKYEVRDANITEESLRMTNEEPNAFYASYIIGASFKSKGGSPIIGVWFNNHLVHSQPLALSYAQNAVFRRISSCHDCSFQFTNEPFPFSDETQQIIIGIGRTDGDSIRGTLEFALIFVSACFILFSIKERACNSRHLQYVAGARVLVFWLVHFLFDFLIYILICLLATIVVVCLQVDGFKTTEDFGRMWVIFTYFGCSALPLMYLIAYIFKVPASGYIFVCNMFYIAGNIFPLILMLVSWKPHIHDSVNKALLFIPHYSLTQGFGKSHRFYGYKKICEQNLEWCKKLGMSEENCWDEMFLMDECHEYHDSYYKLEAQGIGENIMYSLISGLVFFALLLLIEYDFLNPIIWLLSLISCRRPKVPKDEDSDVAEERQRISSMSTKDLKTSYELAIKDLTKYYCRFRAVNGLCLGVKKNECFGLLGVNGAGKTSTFKMMTGDVRMTYGKGWVQGYSLRHQMRKVHGCIGYCPQFDALIDDMTARETLIMFAMIKGYRYSVAKNMAVTFSENLDFREHVDKQVKKLSGGNKRKLSAAVAMIGDPPVLYLDEPTSGMDPTTKYYFREVVRKIRDSGKCIILTSHSLEECESVCTRLAIMADGNFKCIGSVQHLKSKFAKGCTFTIKIQRDANESSINSIQKYVNDNLPSAQLSERHEEMLTYRIAGTEIPWSKIFSILEGGKRNIKDIEDYSLAQGSLEQVFLSFSKQQK